MIRRLAFLLTVLAATSCNGGSGSAPSPTNSSTTPVDNPQRKDDPDSPPPAPRAAETCADVHLACVVDGRDSREKWLKACSDAVDSALAHGADLNADCVGKTDEATYHVKPVFQLVSSQLGTFTDPASGQYVHDEDTIIQMLKYLRSKGVEQHADAFVAGSQNDYFLPIPAALSQGNFKVAEYLAATGQNMDQYGPWGAHVLCDLFYSPYPMHTTDAAYLKFAVTHGFNPNLPCLNVDSPGKTASAPVWLALTRYDDDFFLNEVLPRIKEPGDVNKPVLYYNEQPGPIGQYAGPRAGQLGLGWDYGRSNFDTLPLYVTINHMSVAGTQYLFQHGAKLTSDMFYPILLALYNFQGDDAAFERFDLVVQNLVGHGLSLANYSLNTDEECSRIPGFLAAGMKMDQEPYGTSFLHQCIQNLKALKALAAHGARINVPVNHYWEKDYTELDSAACSVKDPQKAATLAFLKFIGSVHSKVDDNCSPLAQ